MKVHHYYVRPVVHQQALAEIRRMSDQRLTDAKVDLCRYPVAFDPIPRALWNACFDEVERRRRLRRRVLEIMR
jgi:hypothetical protein